MRIKNQLKAGALLSYLNLLIGNIIPFIYTPIMLRMLGQAEYGLYGIANSIMGYIGLLNFGIGGTIVRYLAKYRATGDREQEERVAGLFVKIYGTICCLILTAGFLLAANIELYGRSLTSEELETLRVLVVLMTINTALFLPFSVFSSIVIAHEKYVVNKLIGILSTVASPLLNLALLFCGFGSVGLVLSSTAMNFLTYGIYTWYALRKLEIRPSFHRTEPGLLREILKFSSFVFLASMVDILYWSTDKLIIGWAIGAAATAVYNIGSTFNGYVTNLSTAISGLLVPRLTDMAVKDAPKEQFTALFIKIGRLQFLLLSFVVSAFVAFGRQFIALWAGPGYEASYYVALLTMLPVTVPLIQNTGLNILYALNKHQFRSVVYLCVALLNIVLTFWWVEDYGIIGAAMATCLAYVLGNIIIINIYYYKAIGLDIPLFWRNILRMSPVMFLMGGAWWVLLDHIQVESWLVFLGLAVAYTLMYIPLAYRFMMNSYERELIKGPVRKVLRRLSRGGGDG
ncbi:oligosaccharide flippase family protein [uncultured Intestinimonas sp.]|uniref:oligosaccharide flippase family protein n=1 Tax=uncultured Intestinimonas sp. TaxID=1689265 RepID=UPI0025E787A5|nr:oligosaccharide flippase family protein [uncultured Intestinimonas sp.]